MEKYNYLENVTNDVKNWINENDEWRDDHTDESGQWLRDDNFDDLCDELNGRLFCADSVTGNVSGSYTFSTWKAEENLCHNLDLLAEALEEFGYDSSYILENGAEACDVTIRCYLLGQAITTALEELRAEKEEEEEDAE